MPLTVNLLTDCHLDFEYASANHSPYSPYVSSTTNRKAWVEIDKLRRVESPCQANVELSDEKGSQQLENFLSKQTTMLQKATKLSVTRGIEVTISREDVTGHSSTITANLALEFGNINKNINLKFNDIMLNQRSTTRKAFELKEWFDFTGSLGKSWSNGNANENEKFTGKLTLNLQFLDEALIMIRLDNPKRSPSTVLQKMLEDASTTGDAIIMADNGCKIPCHKAFLIAQSEVFKVMFTSGMKEDTTSTVELDDMSEAGVRALLAYLYCSNITAATNDCGIAFELVKAADKYELRNLQEDMKHVILSQQASGCTVATAINLWSFSKKKMAIEGSDTLGGYKEIGTKAIGLLKSKTQGELNQCQEFQDMLNSPEFTRELCVYLILNN